MIAFRLFVIFLAATIYLAMGFELRPVERKTRKLKSSKTSLQSMLFSDN